MKKFTIDNTSRSTVMRLSTKETTKTDESITDQAVNQPSTSTKSSTKSRKLKQGKLGKLGAYSFNHFIHLNLGVR